jgi:peptidyl-prolyl cis-trans isomerase SurA
MRTSLGDASGRPALRGVRAALLLTGCLVTAGAAWGQLQAPRYQSPITTEAPMPQLTIPAPPAITPNGTVVEYPIVRVNDQIIDNSDYQRAEQEMLADAQRMKASPTEVAEQQKDLLRDMIDTQLLLSRGKELDLNVDADVIRAMDAMRKRLNLDTMEDLEKAVRAEGMSVEDWKAGIKNQIMQQQVVGKEVGQTLRLTTKQEQAYYDKHKEEFDQPEQVRLSEILVSTPDDATDAQVAQAKARADDVVAKLNAGAVFEDMAKQLSAGLTAATGGDLGEFKRGALGSSALEDPVFALKAGEWTAPIRTRQGYVVLKVTAHTQAGIPPLSDVEPQVQEAVYREAIQPALRTYLTGLREKAYIDIAPGFVDTGSSVNETKPVFAAATPLPVKKKKAQKERLDQSHSATESSATAAAKTAAGSAKPGAATTVAPATDSAAAKTKTTAKLVAEEKKPKKIRKEKIRFGQAPRNALPVTPAETAVAGADLGVSAASGGPPAPGAVAATISGTTTEAADDQPLTPTEQQKKTRYSDRAPIEDKARRDAAKAAKAKEVAAMHATAPLTAEEQAKEQAQAAPLGLGGDTATKKKPKKVKGAAKERLQEQAPAPPKAKPEATPIPPKSVRENGEPVVNPPPPVPAVTVPADAQPSAPASPAAAK